MKNSFKDYSQSIAAGICILVLESFYNLDVNYNVDWH